MLLMIKLNFQKNKYHSIKMSERKAQNPVCKVILSKYSKNSGKICGRKLPCNYHSVLNIDELMLKNKKQ